MKPASRDSVPGAAVRRVLRRQRRRPPQPVVDDDGGAHRTAHARGAAGARELRGGGRVGLGYGTVGGAEDGGGSVGAVAQDGGRAAAQDLAHLVGDLGEHLSRWHPACDEGGDAAQGGPFAGGTAALGDVACGGADQAVPG
ncbi:hypothetical protein N7U49_12760 [Streptomyces sp. AD2-2]|nr:hypothetical protein N7U49_12760 [Streptomyces sp. AD2-2]